MFQRLPTVLLLLLLGLGQLGFAQPATWQKTKLDSVATIEFPGPVTRQQVQGHEVYVYKEGPTVCLVLAQPTSSLVGMVAADNDQFYEGMVKGVLEETGGKLLHKSTFQVGGFSGVEVQFATPDKPQLPATKFTRMVLVNSTVYTLNYWTSAKQDAASVAERNQFFTSFQVTAKPVATRSTAYKLGNLMGHFFIYGLLVAGIIWLVRRLRKSKQSIN